MNQTPPSAPARPLAAFVISLIAGLWMLAMGGMTGWGYMGAGTARGYMTPYGNAGTAGSGSAGSYDWMWRHHGLMHAYGGGAWPWIGVGVGVVVLVGAVTMYSRPTTTRGWGIAILAASAVGLLSGAGGLLAGALGIVGGILAMTWTAQRQR